MTVLGTIVLWLTMLLGTWALFVGLVGRKWRRPELAESSRRAALVLPALLWVAVLSLVAALLRRDLNVTYVSDHVSRNLSSSYTVAALLAGWNGFGMVCLAALSLFSIPSLARYKATPPVVIGVSVVILVATGALLFAADPFRRLGITPVDGGGLDPLLLGPVLIVERPLALLGYAAIGMAIALLPAGLSNRATVRWLGFGWLLLASALTVGLWQAYRFAGPDAGFEWSRDRRVVAGTWLVVSLLLGGLAAMQGDRLRSRLKSPGPLAIIGGLVCLIVGVASGRGGAAREVRVKAGASVSIPSSFGGSYALTHMGISRFQMADRVTAAATLDATRNLKPVGLITSDKRQYFGLLGQPIEGPVTTVGIHRGVLEDVRVVFREATANEEALYQIRVVPLASLLWLGAALLILGGLLTTVGAGE